MLCNGLYVDFNISVEFFEGENYIVNLINVKVFGVIFFVIYKVNIINFGLYFVMIIVVNKLGYVNIIGNFSV